MAQFRRRSAHAHHKCAKSRINGANFVKTHLVDQLLEDQRVVGEQIDAPLPVIEPDRPRDDLPDLARFFLRRYNVKFRRNIQGIADSTMQILCSYW